MHHHSEMSHHYERVRRKVQPCQDLIGVQDILSQSHDIHLITPYLRDPDLTFNSDYHKKVDLLIRQQQQNIFSWEKDKWESSKNMQEHDEQ